MSLTETPAGRERAFSEVLVMLALSRAPRLSLAEVVQAFGDRAFGAVMLLVALLNLLPWPPGGTTVLGAPLVLLSIQLMRGRSRLWLPAWTLAASVDRRAYRRFMRWFVPPIRWMEGLSRPRLLVLTGGPAQAALGVIMLVLAVILTLPIPFGNMAPAATIALISLGVMQRDGIAVILGLLATVFSLGLLVAAWAIIVHMAVTAWGWLGI